MKFIRHTTLGLALLGASAIAVSAAAQPSDAAPVADVSVKADSILTPDLSGQEVFRHHRVAVGDVRLHFVRGGKGKPLFLLHGWPSTWWEWHKVTGLGTRF